VDNSSCISGQQVHLLTAYTGNSTIIQSKYTNEYGATIGNLLYNYELK
jgi:hypothetical protein